MSRTVVDLRDDLVRKVSRLTGLTKKVDVVNYALEHLVAHGQRQQILKLAGKLHWEGNLAEMRRNRHGSR